MVLNDFLYNINPNTMVLGLLFIIFFVFIQFALSRTMKDKSSSGIIAFCISLLAVYGLNRTSLDLSGMFSNIGITEEILYSVIPFIILAGVIFMIWKLKLSRTLMLVGIALIVASFFVYEQTWVLILGIVLFVIGFLLWLRERKKKGQNTGNQPANSDVERQHREVKLRTASELRQKYAAHSNEIKKIMAGRGRIPSPNSTDSNEARLGQLYHRNIQAMKAIEGLAKAQGISL